MNLEFHKSNMTNENRIRYPPEENYRSFISHIQSSACSWVHKTMVKSQTHKTLCLYVLIGKLNVNSISYDHDHEESQEKNEECSFSV
jgi:hypothetical protein